MIRSPILVALGHVDHGKTTLIDRIRGSAVAKTEPGFITQHISASYIPLETIKERAGPLMSKGFQLTIPGILWMDSPGHEAFTTLRKRGGAIADFAVLVVDIHEGFQPQTRESVMFLKQFKTPFVVALTKIDRILGWQAHPNASFRTTYEDQPERTQEEFEKAFYRVVGQLGQDGFNADRFDRVEDFTKQIAIVPVSSFTGEGIADLLVIISGIAQKFLTSGLELQSGTGKGTVLEVKEYPGLGTTIDAIVYDGTVRRGDYLVIGGRAAIASRVKAILKPAPLKDMRKEKEFQSLEEVTAAAAVKIAAPGLGGVVAGSPFRSVKHPQEVVKATQEVIEEVEEVEFESAKEGVFLRADTLGSLEALIKTLQPIVPIRSASVGSVVKADIMEAKITTKPIIFAFAVHVTPDMQKLAKDNTVALFSSDVIYHMVEEYQKWEQSSDQRAKEHLLASVQRPAAVRVLPGYIFRQKKPAVVGVEVEKGTLRSGSILENKGTVLGQVKELQDNGENKTEAVKGERVAVSLPDAVVGKDLKEGDLLVVRLSERDRSVLLSLRGKLREDERELLLSDV